MLIALVEADVDPDEAVIVDRDVADILHTIIAESIPIGIRGEVEDAIMDQVSCVATWVDWIALIATNPQNHTVNAII